MAKGRAAFFWKAVENIVSQIVSLGIFLLLVALLDPSHFGLFAVVLAINEFAKIVFENTFTQEIERSPRIDSTRCSTAYWLTVGVALAVYAVIFAAAPLADRLIADGPGAEVVRVAGLAILAGAAGNVHQSLLRRRLAFRGIAIRSLTAQLAAGALAVTLARAGYGVWALVAQIVLAAIVMCAFNWVLAKWVPRLRFSRAMAGELLRFGGTVSTSRLIRIGRIHLLRLLIGSAYGVALLGTFTVAQRIARTTERVVGLTIGQVSLPYLGRIQGDPAAFHGRLATIFETAALIAAPILLCLAVLAGPAIAFLFDDVWLPAAAFLPPLCVIAFTEILLGLVGIAPKAQGRPRTEAAIWFSTLVVDLGTVGAFLLAGGDLVAAIWTVAALRVVLLAGALAVLRKAVSLDGGDLMRRAWAPIAASVAIFLAYRWASAGLPAPGPILMALHGTAILAVYAVAVGLLDNRLARRFVGTVRPRARTPAAGTGMPGR